MEIALFKYLNFLSGATAMPIYEYVCTQCHHELEAIQKISADPLTDCPVCEQPTLLRKISAAAFRLKGGGWYETDFKTQNQRQLATGDSDAPKSDASKSGEKKTDTAAKSTTSGDAPKPSTTTAKSSATPPSAA